ncbi:MAG: hypothetical protein A2428_01465 [Bdellovibrionales bacterium RIFOXYC1_FULL_54_43]|nr:MAG: hypothetical protein A2428_01465 [Bdellovibrionales bacterium RIFOXYC1_FULL_54_43]OFZ79822.1 MAG: hypothetical protein A2603_05720 [Bdellovibrionales bacterium RIFOXYD1_FULL_55_31]
MWLELSTEEVQTLKSALFARLHEMIEELVHTDDREYRLYLRKDVDAIERILFKFEKAAGKGGLEAGSSGGPEKPGPEMGI